MSIEIDGDVQVAFRVRVPIQEAHRIARLIEELGHVAANEGATIETVEQPKQLPAPKARQRKPRTHNCSRCGEPGHRRNKCPQAVAPPPPAAPTRTQRPVPVRKLLACQRCGRSREVNRQGYCGECAKALGSGVKTSKPGECQHHWIIAPLDGSDTVSGVCKICHMKREDFDPHYEPHGPQAPPILRQTKDASRVGPKCRSCGNHPRSHAHIRQCGGVK